MPIDFQSVNMTFPPTSGRRQRQTATAVFGSTVRKADAMLKGYDIGYTNGDHHLLRQEVDIDVLGINGNTVIVAVDFFLRDNSGDIDDPYNGSVEIVVLADVA